MSIKKSSYAALAASISLASGTADATNGYFRLGYSANSIAMGGASTATAQDAMAGASNPALALNTDVNYTLAASVFAPDRSFKVEGGNPMTAQPGEFALMPQDTTSDSHYFVIPSFGYNRKIDDEFAVNVSIYANGGMNTDYSESVFYAGETGVDLSQLFISTSFAYKVADKTHLGIAPIVAGQRFKARGISSFAPFSQDPTKLSDNQYDYSFGYGARIGIWQGINDNWSVGASYQSEIQFQEFEKYEGLFAENGAFNVPETYNLGLEFTRSNYTVALDYQRINYSDVQSVGNPLLPALMTTQLGQDGAAGFGWKDMSVYELGFAINGASDNTYRFGVSYGEQPIPSSEVLFNILAPGVQEWHFTAGYEFGVNDVDYAFALMYSPSKKVKGRNPLLQSQEQTIELEMSQIELTFGANF
jgi:long-chain fatty acid transport protein